MYGLSTPASDKDFHLCYLASTEELLSLRENISLRKLHFSRHVGAHYGAAKEGVLEYSAVELSHYLSTLTKGNPSALELLFVPDAQAIVTAWPWDELVAMRDLFLTDTAYAQYLGFITVHLRKAESYLQQMSEVAALGDASGDASGDAAGGAAAGASPSVPLAHDAAAAVSKALYHTFVKLFECGRIVRGEALHVRLRGAEHELCWAIRTQPLVGDLDPSVLIRRATTMLEQLKADKAQLATPLRRPPDVSVLHDWMLSVRLRCLARDGTHLPSPSTTPPPPPPLSRSASASSTCTSAASIEAVGPAACERVNAAIRQLEAAEGVTVLWAVERSSRAFGTHRSDSDLDVLAVFSLSPDALLSIHPPRKSLILTLGEEDADAHTAAHGGAHAAADGGAHGGSHACAQPDAGGRSGGAPTEAQITIHAHELRHACTLLAASNPTMFEALQSSIVYRDHPALGEARKLLEETCDTEGLRHAYRKMARGDFQKYVLQRGVSRKGATRLVLGKKYAHVLRALLMADWLGQRRGHASSSAVDVGDIKDGAIGSGGGGSLPPIQLVELAAPAWVDVEARDAVSALLASREQLATPSPPRATLEDWVRARLSEPDYAPVPPVAAPVSSLSSPVALAPPARWDAFCVTLLRGAILATSSAPVATPAGLDAIGRRYIAKPSSAKRGDKYFGGDKTSEGQHFTRFYEHILAPFRTRPGVQFLELGVYFGKSLAMWADYFDDGTAAGTCTVHGVDIDLRRYHAHHTELEALGAFRRNHVVVHEFDTTSPAFATFAHAELPELDIVLDDGCHTAASQWQCFALLFPRLRSGGLYVVEDIERPSAFFGDGACSGFGALLAAVANETALQDTDELGRERERWVQREDGKLTARRDRIARSLEGLRASMPRAEEHGGGTDTVQVKKREALAAKEKQLAEVDATLDAERARARGAARAAFDERTELIRRFCGEIVSVEVRTMNVVFAKK